MNSKYWSLVLLTIVLLSAGTTGAQVEENAKVEAQEEKAIMEESTQEVEDSGNWFYVHYRNRMNLFKKENAELLPEAKNYVFVGDSITEGFPLTRYFQGKRVLNRGISGDGIGFEGEKYGVLNRLEECVFDCQPEVVFLLIGVNNLPHEGVAVEGYVTAYRLLVERIQERLPETPLVIQTVLPVGLAYARHAFLNPRILEFNEGIVSIAQEKSLDIIDLHALYRDEDGLLPSEVSGDGLHLSPDAYSKWAEQAAKYMQ